jgi:DNA-binding IclR family transcriptional regulator
MPKPESTTVIDRVFAILDTCANSRRTLSLADLVRETGLPKSTLHRLCRKLATIGALEYRPDGFRIGPRLFSLGALNPAMQRLRTQSMPSLYRMSADTGLITNLAVLQGDRALLIDEVFPDERPVPRMVGGLLPVHASALGKALLAWEPMARRRELLGTGELERFTRHTVTDRDKLLVQLDTIRETGISFSQEEMRLGFAGVAAPIVLDGKAEGAIALIGIPRASDTKSYAGIVKRAAVATAAALRNPVIRDARATFAEVLDS